MLSLSREGQFYQVSVILSEFMSLYLYSVLKVFLSQGLGMGLGAGLIFTPTAAVVGLHFKRRRSLALGTAMTGISLGAVAFPIRSSNFVLAQITQRR
jgi:MFS family permease